MSTMQAITTGVQTRIVRRVLVALSLALLFATPLLTSAQGPGTLFFRCRDQALIDLGVCYLNASGWIDKVKCNFAWEVDLLGCDADAISELIPIVSVMR